MLVKPFFNLGLGDNFNVNLTSKYQMFVTFYFHALEFNIMAYSVDNIIESSQWKLHRRKSETFRAQYIQNKELR